jgi:iron complex outermembrane receptor protein
MDFSCDPRKESFAVRLSRGASFHALSLALAVSVAGVAHASDSDALVMAAGAAGDAPAAAASSNEVTAVVVTGIRGGIERSIRAKKASDSIVEAVTAEDIGKLPDTSIAESIARLPGLTAQRLNGRDQVVTVRGFGPDFTTALLNGREQVTTGDNRGVEYDQYPSELMAAVKVAKTPDAALIGQGMVGTVELSTLRPLDQSHRILSFQLRKDWDSYGALNPGRPNDGFRFSGLYADKTSDGVWGVMLGMALQNTATQNKSYNSWGFPTDSAGDYIIGGGKEYGQSDLLERNGFVATVEYKPNDRFHSTFDAFLSNFTETDYLRGIEFPLAWSGATQSNITAQNGFVQSVTFGGVHAIQRNDYNQRKASTFSLGWNNQYEISDKLLATVDVSWSHAKRKDFLLENYSGFGYGGSGPGDSITATRNSNGTYSLHQTLNYTNVSQIYITDPGGWGGNYLGSPYNITQAGYLNNPNFSDDLRAIRADLKYELGNPIFKSVQVGANFSRREKISAFTGYFLTLGNDASGAPIRQIPIPAAAVVGPASPIGYLGVQPTLALNPTYLWNNVYTKLADNQPNDLARQYLVREDVALVYVKGNIETQIHGIPVRGNAGFQVVSTDQFSSGATPTVVTTTTPNKVVLSSIKGSDSYVNFLPSMNLIFDLGDGKDIRFGAARTLARPRLDQERISSTVNTNLTYLTVNNPLAGQSYFSGSGGNVRLHPYISDGLDLTFEKYFGSSGYVSVQTFYKHLTQYVNPNLSHLQDFSSLAPLLLTPTQLSQLATSQGLVSAPANSGFGDIYGIEVTASMPLKMLHPMLDGFGIEASGSLVDSEVKYEASDKKYLPIEGQSKSVQNLTFYYEKNGFQFRTSARYRSKFLGEVSGLSASRTFTGVKAETIIDAQIGYTFQSGPLKNLAIQLEGKNLNDAPFVTYANSDIRQVTDYQKYGPTYMLGMSYKF